MKIPNLKGRTNFSGENNRKGGNRVTLLDRNERQRKLYGEGNTPEKKAITANAITAKAITANQTLTETRRRAKL
ncbi:predicted protein [Arabidopsis lyrata subsp. lyrata]|uniref:Predicted protein n=1 Tax=Arabidopsis lyrata subsp. lyrata TaxID=81972 RepID=D7L2Q5_ARALL|nr:predicted protein [Arabidopsis lyrata subsp. lyrata]